MAAFKAFWNSPVGPKTTHFWGPVANFGFVAAALADINKPAEMLSGNMTGAMCVYSALSMSHAIIYCLHVMLQMRLFSSINIRDGQRKKGIYQGRKRKVQQSE